MSTVDVSVYGILTCFMLTDEGKQSKELLHFIYLLWFCWRHLMFYWFTICFVSLNLSLFHFLKFNRKWKRQTRKSHPLFSETFFHPHTIHTAIRLIAINYSMWALRLHRANTTRYEQIVIYGFLTARQAHRMLPDRLRLLETIHKIYLAGS